jgi:glycosyltransferase involved in cell wall biosynthesis
VPELSIVIPAYNEARRIPGTLVAWDEALAGRDAEIIVASDGSTDDTVAVVGAIAAERPRIRCLDLRPNRGKGAAVRDGMLAAAGEHRVFVDADLNISTDHLDPMLALLRASADVVIARRHLGEYAREERSLRRLAAGAAVQITRRATLLPTVTDTQAGFKGFRAAAAEVIFRRTTVDGFAFDIEVLYLARRLGLRLAEIPVSVEYRAESTYDVRTHLGPFLRDILAVRARAWRRGYDLAG